MGMHAQPDSHLSYWDYLSPHQQDLIREGGFLYQEIFATNTYSFRDYSFIVFPFAKAFEGFIKKFLLDIGLITIEQYNSDHIRIGKLLSPERLNNRMYSSSIYTQLSDSIGSVTAEKLWLTWKYCRNQVFHYYPHNSKSIDLIGAKERIHMILTTMTACYNALQDTAARYKFD